MYSFPWLYLVAWLTSVAIIIWWYERSLRNLRSNIRDAKHRAEFIEEELAACRKKVYSNEPDVDTTQEVTAALNVNAMFDQQLHLTSQKDDLKIVEGIGPKIEKLFHEASIFTFSDLSKTEISYIKDILERAGSRYLMHDPTTWPKQAKLAMEGRWDELKKWQSELDKGRIV
jgi:predicted flap endonuclease-1-like 5' DNA nuclease